MSTTNALHIRNDQNTITVSSDESSHETSIPNQGMLLTSKSSKRSSKSKSQRSPRGQAKSFKKGKSFRTSESLANIEEDDKGNWAILNFPLSIYYWFTNAIIYEKKKDGSNGSILYYNVDYAITVGWLIPRQGSVFSILEQLIVVGVSVMVCVLLGWGSCLNQPNSSTCIRLPNADTSYLTLTTLCSFTVAFFANSVLERWWSIRKHLQAVMNAGYELVIIFAGILSSDIKDAHSAKERHAIRMEKKRLMNNIIGLLVLTLRLLFNSARGLSDYEDLVDRSMLSQAEYEYFVSINATSLHVCGIMLNYIQEAARQGLLGQAHGVSEANMQTLQTSILAVRANAASVSLYIDVQMPYPFIQIISAVTYMFMIQLTLVCSAFIGQGLANDSTADVTTGILTISLYNFVLLGLLRLFDVLYNPLGDDAADFPGDTYMAIFETDLISVSKNAFVLIDNNGILPRSTESVFLAMDDEDLQEIRSENKANGSKKKKAHFDVEA